MSHRPFTCNNLAKHQASEHYQNDKLKQLNDTDEPKKLHNVIYIDLRQAIATINNAINRQISHVCKISIHHSPHPERDRTKAAAKQSPARTKQNKETYTIKTTSL